MSDLHDPFVMRDLLEMPKVRDHIREIMPAAQGSYEDYSREWYAFTRWLIENIDQEKRRLLEACLWQNIAGSLLPLKYHSPGLWKALDDLDMRICASWKFERLYPKSTT